MYSDKDSEFSDEISFNNQILKVSLISGKIHIDNNWTAAKSAGICKGEGNYSEPYIIEDLIIDGGASGSCILIENSNVFFRVENCTLYNSGYFPNAGIKLNNITNAQLINNDCSSNYIGIYLYNSENNKVSENSVDSNAENGINLYFSDKNIISGNYVSDNLHGIYLYNSNSNNISGNTANNNRIYGINLSFSNNNTVSGNVANDNLYGIAFSSNRDNTISGNLANYNQIYGIYLYKSNYNTVSGNNANNNDDSGLYFYESFYFNVSENIANNNDHTGIYLWDCAVIIILKNNASSNIYNGISLEYCGYINIIENDANNNGDGIELLNSVFNNIIGNNVSNNNNGVYLKYSDNNTISSNNLILNDRCWREIDCLNNIFVNNICRNREIMAYPHFNVQGILMIFGFILAVIGFGLIIRYYNYRKKRILKPILSQRVNESTKSCPECGTPITQKEDLFCTNCGQNLK
ncbi:MAG: NosD domain-containing protein [Candidatus Hodarchaeota archaeon]